jgi:hypothetical protein
LHFASTNKAGSRSQPGPSGARHHFASGQSFALNYFFVHHESSSDLRASEPRSWFQRPRTVAIVHLPGKLDSVGFSAPSFFLCVLGVKALAVLREVKSFNTEDTEKRGGHGEAFFMRQRWQ